MIVAYADRWKWLKAVLASPTLTASTKVVLAVIFEAMDAKKTGVTRYHSTLAKGAGIKERAVRGCLRQAATEGFIVIDNRGGGINWSDDGKAKGKPCKFSLALPGTAVPSIATTRHGNVGYPAQKGEIPGTDSSDTRHGGAYNTPFSSPFSSPSTSPDEVGPWPTASAEVIATWGDRWPPSDKMAEKFHNIGQARANVAEQCFLSMGFTVDDGKTIYRSRPAYQDIRDKLPKDWSEVIAAQLERGECKLTTLAEVMASLGFTPKDFRDAA